MPKLLLFIFLLLGCLQTACKKEDYTPQPGLYTPTAPLPTKGIGVSYPVTGTWEWIKGYSSIDGPSSPGLNGFTERVTFGTDSIMTIKRNGIYYYEFRFLYVSNYKYKDRTFDLLKVSGYNYETRISNDTLYLSTFDLVDENRRSYTRVK